MFNYQVESACECAPQSPVQASCPYCNLKGRNVDAVTIKSQLKKEVRNSMLLGLDLFNFCSNPDCDTVYYSNDKSESFSQKDIKSKVTIKNDDPKTPLCYCRKLLKENVREMIENRESHIVQKVKEIIADGKSFCEKSNPKGICCTEDITSFLAEYDIHYNEKKKAIFSLNPNPSSCCDSSDCC